MSITSFQFDIAITSLAIPLAFNQMSGEDSIVRKFSYGILAFSLSAMSDRMLREIFLINCQKKKISFLAATISALFEESIYSGILQTRKTLLLFPRLFFSWAVGSTASQSLYKKWDIQIGFCWGIIRELISSKYPFFISFFADPLIFGLCEVCPTQNSTQNALEKFSSPWIYKLLSAGIFRFIANTMLPNGFLVPIIQHVFFNFSRTLPEKKRGFYTAMTI